MFLPSCETSGHGAEAEELRINALEELGLLDTAESESFDRITRMASQLLGAPVSAVSLTDRTRQWFKSHVGTAGREIPRASAPCAEVTLSQEVLHVPDLLEDERFAESPLAQSGIRFYAGAPLTTRQGHTLGAMCVLDTKPRTLTPEQLRSLEDFAAMVMAQVELQHELGRIDASSGLPNRHQLYDDIEDQRRNQPNGARVLLLIELVDLRHVNEAVSVLGASYLDELIKVAARAIKSASGKRDGLYQTGFASLALLLEDREPWRPLLETIATHLKELTSTIGIPLTLAPVCGVMPFFLGATAPQNTLRTAVSAAHDARQAEVAYAIYDADKDEAGQRRFHLLTHFRQSLEEKQHLQLVYQPRLDLHTGKCGSAEALLRWSHPELGSVSPGEFIPLVEQTALAQPMTQWVLASAFEQVKAWRTRGLNTRVSINVSARNLEEADFVELLADLLASHGVHSTDVELEFTESALIRYQTRVLAQLTKVRDMGVDLAIDDFGTGYSSFAYLHRLPATTVKLDQSFMRTLAHGTKNQALVRSMISMAHDIGYRVVAEGVETEEALRFLDSCGCDEIQGYLIARPLAPEACEAFCETSYFASSVAGVSSSFSGFQADAGEACDERSGLISR